MITIYKRVGMGLVIDELNPSPNPYPQKITRMKEGFPKEKEREIFFFFLTSHHFIFTLSSQKPYTNFYINFLPHFSFIGKMKEWECTMVH